MSKMTDERIANDGKKVEKLANMLEESFERAFAEEMQKNTDKDIIKALDCCSKSSWIFDCEGCPCYDPKEDIQTSECQERLMKDALDLINRQQHQLENYSHNVRTMTKDFIDQQKIIQEQQAEIDRLERHTEMYHELRADAIKEFAESLIAELNEYYCEECRIDTLIKERLQERVREE